jgi:hypothetical protein
MRKLAAAVPDARPARPAVVSTTFEVEVASRDAVDGSSSRPRTFDSNDERGERRPLRDKRAF